MPAQMAVFISGVEFFGGLFLAIGLFLATALVLTINMIMASRNRRSRLSSQSFPTPTNSMRPHRMYF
jgi:hypothetical protein